MKAETHELIRYRIARADETLQAAATLLADGLLHDTVNRLYYSCFYMVTALPLTEGLSSAKHGGVQGLFDREWINKGRLPVTMGRFFRKLFKHRQRGDYDDLVVFSLGNVEAWLQETREFLAEVRKGIEEQIDNAPDRDQGHD